MSIEGQGHFFTIYFPGFVCFVLYYAKISGERLQDHWSSGFVLFYTLQNLQTHLRSHRRPTERCKFENGSNTHSASKIFKPKHENARA